jgi:hypothetical protein
MASLTIGGPLSILGVSIPLTELRELGKNTCHEPTARSAFSYRSRCGLISLAFSSAVASVNRISGRVVRLRTWPGWRPPGCVKPLPPSRSAPCLKKSLLSMPLAPCHHVETSFRRTSLMPSPHVSRGKLDLLSGVQYLLTLHAFSCLLTQSHLPCPVVLGDLARSGMASPVETIIGRQRTWRLETIQPSAAVPIPMAEKSTHGLCMHDGAGNDSESDDDEREFRAPSAPREAHLLSHTPPPSASAWEMLMHPTATTDSSPAWCEPRVALRVGVATRPNDVQAREQSSGTRPDSGGGMRSSPPTTHSGVSDRSPEASQPSNSAFLKGM